MAPSGTGSIALQRSSARSQSCAPRSPVAIRTVAATARRAKSLIVVFPRHRRCIAALRRGRGFKQMDETSAAAPQHRDTGNGGPQPSREEADREPRERRSAARPTAQPHIPDGLQALLGYRCRHSFTSRRTAADRVRTVCPSPRCQRSVRPPLNSRGRCAVGEPHAEGPIRAGDPPLCRAHAREPCGRGSQSHAACARHAGVAIVALHRGVRTFFESPKSRHLTKPWLTLMLPGFSHDGRCPPCALPVPRNLLRAPRLLRAAGTCGASTSIILHHQVVGPQSKSTNLE